MDDIERKALALVNEVERERTVNPHDDKIERIMRGLVMDDALCRAIEQHEAFRHEVSDAVVAHQAKMYVRDTPLDRFIIAKPDPLIEVGKELRDTYCPTLEAWSKNLRVVIEKRGGKIVWGDE